MKRSRGTCNTPSCDSAAEVKGLCKPCYYKTWALNNPDKVKARNTKWRKNHPDKESARRKRWTKNNPLKVKIQTRQGYRRRRYQLTPQDDQLILRFQKNQCPICQENLRGYHTDHDHACCPDSSCGKCIRGFLCARCNRVLGYLEEDSRLLGTPFIKYLGRYAKLRAKKQTLLEFIKQTCDTDVSN